MRFLRPVEFAKGAAGELVDGVPTGDRLEIGKIFSATDWQGFKIFWYDETAGEYKKGYYPEGLDETTTPKADIDWYGYYGFSKLIIDVDKVETDQNGSFKLLKEVNSEAKCWVCDKAAPMTPVSPAEVDLTDINNLQKYMFTYFNNMGVVEDFHLRIPYTIQYAWGDYNDYVDVLVRKTYTPKVGE